MTIQELLLGYSVFGETRAHKLHEETTEINLGAGGEKKLELARGPYLSPNLRTKSDFIYGARAKNNIEFEVMLAFWLSWYVFPNGPEDGLNSYMFPLAIGLARGHRLALAPLPRSLFYCLDE